MIAAPLLFALAAWFLGTAAVVWLNSRAPATFARSLRIGAVLSLAATLWLAVLVRDPSPAAAYAAFAAAIVIWGWHELAFLTGAVMGPNRTLCPAGLAGWPRFRAATATVIHHEVALAAHLALIAAIGWEQPNQTATAAFAALFVLRLSAKLNLFLGVANLSDEVFPARLAYLKSYFGARRWTPFYIVSLIGGGWLIWTGWTMAQAASGGAATGAMLVTGLATLGLVEHALLMLPLSDAAMWRWASAAHTSGVRPAISIDERG
ncbi:DUF3623 family protein [Sphingomonas baiyangensis]|uniref:DUF3623 family protein n=1 Tax=Sphingomonas baiyangensis TaxID=2572576 RepID=A0A4U1L6F7_9SPHN|nr:DUF3623 family protein [Sphingomonas baiyangensis]